MREGVYVCEQQCRKHTIVRMREHDAHVKHDVGDAVGESEKEEGDV